MTDWWAKINEEGKEAVTNNFAAMARSQNDLYMVCPDGAVNRTDDNTLSSLSEGTLTRGELQRNAANICRFLLHTHALDRMEGIKAQVEVIGEEAQEAGFGGEMVFYKVENELTIDMTDISTAKGTDLVFTLDLAHIGGYRIEMTGKSELSELAQIPATVFYQSVPMAVFTFNGTGGQWRTMEKKIVLHNKYAALRVYFAQNGLDVKEIKFIFDKPVEEIPDFEAYVRA